MPTLADIHSGKRPSPRRILLYGTQGIGKSTFASMADDPIFIPTEDGLGEIDCHSFPFCDSFAAAMQCIAELYSGEHGYKTVVIDSLDWLERLIWADVCRQRGVDTIEDIGYHKGYTFALSQWREFLSGLDALRSARHMTSIMIAHEKIEKFDSPDTDSYDRYSPNLHKLAAHILQQWCDEVLFATYKVYTKKTGQGINEKHKGIGTGERVIRTSERPSHLAKNRLNLPDELPLDWREYAKYVSTNQQPAIAA